MGTESLQLSQGRERVPPLSSAQVLEGVLQSPRAGAVSWARTQCKAMGICQGECEGQEMELHPQGGYAKTETENKQ